MGRRRIRIANLPPETPDSKIRTTFARYGEIADISEEKWSKAYRYQVSNGVRIANITLTRHVSSVINIDGIRALISYEGQPVTCFDCGETGHQYQGCTKKRNLRQQTKQSNTASWADIARGLTYTDPQSMKEGEIAQAKVPENTNNYDTVPPQQTPTAIVQENSAATMTEYNRDAQNNCTGSKVKTYANTNTEKSQQEMDITLEIEDNVNVALVQDIDEPEYDRYEGELGEKDEDERRERTETFKIKVQEKERENPPAQNESTVQVETHEETPKPTKKLRIDKDRNLTRERKRSKTRLGTTSHV
jgi:hypothetical protein